MPPLTSQVTDTAAPAGASSASTCIGSMCAAGKYGMQGAMSAAEAACTACEAGKYSDSEGVCITLYASLLSPASTGSMLAEVAVGLVCMYLCMYVCMYVGMYMHIYVVYFRLLIQLYGVFGQWFAQCVRMYVYATVSSYIYVYCILVIYVY